MKSIHVTEALEFRSCRLYWYYSRRMNLVQRDLLPTNSLNLGAAAHFALARFYRYEQDPVEALKEFPGAQSLDLSMISTALSKYPEFAREHDPKWEIYGIEEEISTRVPGTRVTLVGTIDLRARVPRGVIIVDHKTCSAFSTPQLIEMNEQMTAYSWLVWRSTGKLPVEVIYSEIKKTDRAGETFRRTSLWRSQFELEQFEGDLIPTAREMTSSAVQVYPNPSLLCQIWACPYRLLCRSRRQGGDVQALVEQLYTTQGEIPRG